jgi:hypothetical protein
MNRDGTDVKAEGQDARNAVLCNEDLDFRALERFSIQHYGAILICDGYDGYLPAGVPFKTSVALYHHS